MFGRTEFDARGEEAGTKRRAESRAPPWCCGSPGGRGRCGPPCRAHPVAARAVAAAPGPRRLTLHPTTGPAARRGVSLHVRHTQDAGRLAHPGHDEGAETTPPSG